MRVAFYNDPDSGQPHALNHGVSAAEVLDLFRRSPLHLHGREGTMIALGQTAAAGRHLKVIYRRRSQDILVITAYDLRGKELKAFRRRRRRRD